MTTAQKTLKDFIADERLLKPGVKVIAYWTSSGNEYTAQAEVVKVNAKTILVRLLHKVSVDWRSAYSEGTEISCPRVMNAKKWSWRNRVELLAPTGKPLSVEDLKGLPLTKVQSCKIHAGNLPEDGAGVPLPAPIPMQIPVDPKEWAEWCQKNGKWSKLHDAIAYAYVLGWYAKGATTDEGKFAAVLEAFKTNPELRVIAERLL